MIKRRRLSLRRRRQTTFLISILIILTVITSPFVLRMDRLRQAESVYDVQRVKEELQWWRVHGGIFNKLALIRDTSLWVELNVGGENLEAELAMYQDEKHQFWLFLLNLQKGKMNEAQNVLKLLDKTTLGQLGLGMIATATGDVEESSRLLTEADLDWKTMPKHAQALRHFTLTQASIGIGDFQVAKTELEAAQRLEPNNPACLSIAFDIAIGEGQWVKAQEISRVIMAQTWRPKNTLFETKKAVLAIHENKMQELSDSLFVLKGLPGGDACINYVNGVQALCKGQMEEGKSLLELALKSGLDSRLKADAQKSVDQVTSRQNADRILRYIVLKNGEQ